MKRPGGQGTIPKGWRLVQLGDVARFVNGRAFRPDEWGKIGLPIVRIQNLNNPDAPFNFFGGEVAKDNLIANNDVVMSWSATLETRTWQGGPAILNQHIFKVLADPSVAEQCFVFHLLQMKMASLRQQVHGTTMQHITKGNFESTSIPIPPLAEQRAIATVLDSIDDAIEGTEAVIAATEQLRDSLLHQLLTRGVPGWHTEWNEAPGLGTIPAGWEVVRLGEVAEVNRDHWNPSDSSSISYLDLTAVVAPGELSAPREIVSEEAPSRARRKVHSGDILVSTVRPNLRGFARVREASANLVASTGFAVLTPVANVDGSLIYHNVMTERFASYLENATTGQAYPAVRPGDVADFRLPLPPLSEQQAIAGVLDGVDAAIGQAKHETNMLKLLKDSTADALLTGRVRGNESIIGTA